MASNLMIRGLFPSIRQLLFGAPKPVCGYAAEFRVVTRPVWVNAHCDLCQKSAEACSGRAEGVRVPNESIRVETCPVRPDPRCMGSLCLHHCTLTCCCVIPLPEAKPLHLLEKP